VDHSCALDERAGAVGSTRRVQVGRMALVERIVTWEPPRRLGYRIEGLPARLGAVTNEWTLTAEGAGAAVTLTTTVSTGPRPPQLLVERVVARRLAMASKQMLAGLADHLSRPHPPTEPEVTS
jgi:hypothetical protein